MVDCLFCKIAVGDIDSDIIYSDDELVAFSDINPQAPVHKLIIPRKHIATINEVSPTDDQALMGKMILLARQLAHEYALQDNGYRLVFNINKHGGQDVYHIHLHLLGGRQFTWPPG